MEHPNQPRSLTNKKDVSFSTTHSSCLPLPRRWLALQEPNSPDCSQTVHPWLESWLSLCSRRGPCAPLIKDSAVSVCGNYHRAFKLVRAKWKDFLLVVFMLYAHRWIKIQYSAKKSCTFEDAVARIKHTFLNSQQLCTLVLSAPSFIIRIYNTYFLQGEKSLYFLFTDFLVACTFSATSDEGYGGKKM